MAWCLIHSENTTRYFHLIRKTSKSHAQSEYPRYIWQSRQIKTTRVPLILVKKATLNEHIQFLYSILTDSLSFIRKLMKSVYMTTKQHLCLSFNLNGQMQRWLKVGTGQRRRKVCLVLMFVFPF